MVPVTLGMDTIYWKAVLLPFPDFHLSILQNTLELSLQQALKKQLYWIWPIRWNWWPLSWTWKAECRSWRSFNIRSFEIAGKLWFRASDRLWKNNTLSVSDLKDGPGDPWAGQERLNGCSEAFSRVELFSSPENLGIEPPTGSENVTVKELNDMMEPATLEPGMIVLVAGLKLFELFDFPAKLGADPPTGSAIELCVNWPIWWIGWPLSWTKQTPSKSWSSVQQ